MTKRRPYIKPGPRHVYRARLAPWNFAACGFGRVWIPAGSRIVAPTFVEFPA